MAYEDEPRCVEFMKRWDLRPATGKTRFCTRRLSGGRCCEGKRCEHLEGRFLWDENAMTYLLPNSRATLFHAQPYIETFCSALAYQNASSLRPSIPQIAHKFGLHWVVTLDRDLSWYWPSRVFSVFLWHPGSWNIPTGFFDRDCIWYQSEDPDPAASRIDSDHEHQRSTPRHGYWQNGERAVTVRPGGPGEGDIVAEVYGPDGETLSLLVQGGEL
ncbi:MAG: hypothetical protein ACLFU6_12820, partial [Candidatus Hydrogenedentota bacterium]